MTAASDSWLDEVRQLAGKHADQLTSYFDETTRPRLAQMLRESAAVAVRAAAGEDVTTATIALEASTANLARTQKSIVELQGRELALKAAWTILARLAAAAG